MSSSFWSCTLLVRVLLVGFVVVVVRGIVGRVGCLSLLLMKSLSVASHFELSSAAVGQVMSLVRSLLSLLDLSGTNQNETSSHRQRTFVSSHRNPEQATFGTSRQKKTTRLIGRTLLTGSCRSHHLWLARHGLGRSPDPSFCERVHTAHNHVDGTCSPWMVSEQ